MFYDKITETTYTRHDFKAAGQLYRVIIAKGKFNYIDVCKVSNNPFGGKIGKEFKNFDDAQKHYKSPAIKLELLNIELFAQ